MTHSAAATVPVDEFTPTVAESECARGRLDAPPRCEEGGATCPQAAPGDVRVGAGTIGETNAVVVDWRGRRCLSARSTRAAPRDNLLAMQEITEVRPG